MATIDLKKGGTTGYADGAGRVKPFVFDHILTAAEAVAAKGSALAAADVIEIQTIPAECVLMFGGVEVLTIDSGTTVTFSYGDSTDVDHFNNAADFTTLGFPVPGTGGTFAPLTQRNSADVLQLTAVTSTSAGDDWKIRAYGMIVDVSGYVEPQNAKEAG